MSHTPGPWKADDKGKAVFIPLRAHHCEQLGIQVGFVSWEDDKESLANARLIAAAPELLEALKELDSWLVCACIATPEDMAQSFPHMQQVVSAAIARAEGEQT
jgi:hypothetical protein